jgi:hypothetical protein
LTHIATATSLSREGSWGVYVRGMFGQIQQPSGGWHELQPADKVASASLEGFRLLFVLVVLDGLFLPRLEQPFALQLQVAAYTNPRVLSPADKHQ